MNGYEIQEILSSDALAAQLLSSPWAYTPLRYHRLFSGEESTLGYCRHLLSPPQGSRVQFLACLHESRPVAVARLLHLDWDSNFFSRPMTQLDVIHTGATAMEGLPGLLDAALLSIRTKFVGHHVSCHVDIDDYELLNGLIARGFFMADLKRSYVAKRHSQPLREGRLIFSARPYQPEDYEQVFQILPHFSFISRFSRDPSFQPERVRSMYQKWLEGLLSAPEENKIVRVVFRNKRAIAIGGVKRMNLDHYPVRRTMFGDGLFFGLPEGRGAYMAVLASLVDAGLQISDALETKVSANNIAAVRALEGLHYRPASSQYALHLRQS